MTERTDNPYSPPFGDESETSPSIGWNVMFWLSGLLGILAVALSIFIGYQSTRFLVENNMGIPRYVVASTTLGFGCGIGMLVSAWHWRKRRHAAASLMMLESVTM